MAITTNIGDEHGTMREAIDALRAEIFGLSGTQAAADLESPPPPDVDDLQAEVYALTRVIELHKRQADRIAQEHDAQLDMRAEAQRRAYQQNRRGEHNTAILQEEYRKVAAGAADLALEISLFREAAADLQHVITEVLGAVGRQVDQAPGGEAGYGVLRALHAIIDSVPFSYQVETGDYFTPQQWEKLGAIYDCDECDDDDDSEWDE